MAPDQSVGCLLFVYTNRLTRFPDSATMDPCPNDLELPETSGPQSVRSAASSLSAQCRTKDSTVTTAESFSTTAI